MQALLQGASEEREMMTITLTREEAQQVLDALEDAADHIGCPDDDDAIGVARRTIRARLAQPEPEAVAWLNKLGNGAWIADVLKCEGDEPSEPLYTAPPQRKEWQGLTDEEIMDLCAAQWASHPIDIGRIIEAKLKEKNT
jgi:hypothetical protein